MEKITAETSKVQVIFQEDYVGYYKSKLSITNFLSRKLITLTPESTHPHIWKLCPPGFTTYSLMRNNWGAPAFFRYLETTLELETREKKAGLNQKAYIVMAEK